MILSYRLVQSVLYYKKVTLQVTFTVLKNTVIVLFPLGFFFFETLIQSVQGNGAFSLARCCLDLLIMHTKLRVMLADRQSSYNNDIRLFIRVEPGC